MSHSGGGYTTWQNNTHPQWWKDPGLRKNVASIALLYWCVFAFGYDGSLLAGLQGLKPWQEYFNHPKGSTLGLISAAYYFPKIGMPPVVAWTNDRYGRKIPILIGAILTCIGGIVCCFSNSVGMLIGGRVILGAGYSYHAITAAPLIGEIAHPRIRAIAASGFLATYYVGSVVAAWLCYGMTQVSWKTSNWTWRLPCLLQVAGPFIVIIGWFFLPESPRYYMEIGEEDKAIAYYEKYHANGTSMEQDELVRNEVAEIRESIVLSGKASTTPYSTLFKTPGNRKRVFIFLTVAMGTQLSGNGIVSFYLPSILKLIGITSPPKVGAINGGLAIMNLFVAIFAATQVERLGRRKLWIAGVAGMLVSLAIVGGLSGAYNNKASVAIGSGVIAFLYIFYAFYDISFTALPYLYVPEILPFAIRSKGMAVYNVVQCTCIAFNQYVNPIALDAIAWKYYFVYVAFLGVILGIMIFFFPETKGKTPEEIAFIFDKTMPADVMEDEHVSSNVSFNHDSKDKIGTEHQEELVRKGR